MSWMLEGVTGPDRPAPCCCPVAPCGAVQVSTQGVHPQGVRLYICAHEGRAHKGCALIPIHSHIQVGLPVRPKQVSDSGPSGNAPRDLAVCTDAQSMGWEDTHSAWLNGNGTEEGGVVMGACHVNARGAATTP